MLNLTFNKPKPESGSEMREIEEDSVDSLKKQIELVDKKLKEIDDRNIESILQLGDIDDDVTYQ